jgi:glycosyltransferase involved in cell wall biosynthesis
MSLMHQPKRDRLLMLAPTMPSDRGHGLAMRAGFFLDAYSRCYDVDLVVAPVAGSKEPSQFVQSRVHRLEVLDADRPDTHFAMVTSVRDPLARLDAFRRYGRPSLGAFTGPACRLVKTLAGNTRYHVVHVLRLYLAELAAPWMAESHDRARIVLDCDENDASAYHRIAAMYRMQQNAAAADWAEAEAVAFAGLAAAWLPKFDVVFAASRTDAKSLSAFATGMHVIPNVVPPPASARRQRRRLRTVLFVGNLGYAPNADAVTWFVARVWRRLARAMHFRVRLMIVGANPSARVVRLGRQRAIEVTGSVADVDRYYRDADLAIVPLRAGGGTRIKLIEAANHGVPIVTTALGAEGTTFQHDVDVLVANHSENVLRACLLLLRNGSLSRRLAANARMKANRDYSAAHWRARTVRLLVDEPDRRKLDGVASKQS